jgi:2-desacetyl-2-hydroxyethyl bacteriochlorophyllide A dehydrogenase
MKAVQMVEIGKPLQMREVQVPNIGEHDVLIQIKAAGICHTDEHYHSGVLPVAFMPLTLGHEVAGIVEQVGAHARSVKRGDRVGVHYLATCGVCRYCKGGNEQFCAKGEMIGKQRHGGYAEYLVMPAASVVKLPDDIPFEHAAIMMCSTATSFHALRKGRLKPGERVAVFGSGGVGISAIQLSYIMGASEVYAVDINDEKLKIAELHHAIPIYAVRENPVVTLMELTHGEGVDVALEMVGLPLTMKQAVLSLGKMGRAVMVGLSDQPFEVHVYKELLGKEAEIIGSSDHLLTEIPLVLDYARKRLLDLSNIVTCTIPLDADAINKTLQSLHDFHGDVRTVIG